LLCKQINIFISRVATPRLFHAPVAHQKWWQVEISFTRVKMSEFTEGFLTQVFAAGPVQVKELNISAGIASHDLSTKLKQVESWLEKKHHVRLTLRGKRNQHIDNLDKTLEEMVEQMTVMTAFVSKPKVTREGQVAMCVLRPPSAKELAQKAKTRAEEPQPEASKTLPVSNTDTKEEVVQQGNKTLL
uniref:Translation initiation factor 3 C-terminal domain-containing protein n=1 Tax=Xiphophorus couchianus TaxID=32473 RepID=A0A3B5KVK3_9TELE